MICIISIFASDKQHNALLTPFHSFINNLFNCSHVEGWIEPGISLYTSGTILHLLVNRTSVKGTQQEQKLLKIHTNKNPFSRANICIIFIWASNITNECFKSYSYYCLEYYRKQSWHHLQNLGQDV